jgi:hypothetical protein
MTLKEAIESKRPFRRFGDESWMQVDMYSANQFNANDVCAEDYEILEKDSYYYVPSEIIFNGQTLYKKVQAKD